MQRRQFLLGQFLLGSSLAVGGLAVNTPLFAKAGKSARVVVVGGGFGGATCAKYLKRFDPRLEVTLVVAAKRYTTCPFSNLVIAGLQELDGLNQHYKKLSAQYAIHIVRDWVKEIDAHKKIIKLKETKKPLSYDRLILSPGIDFKWDTIENYTAATSAIMPHAWQAGSQTLLLRKQLQAMSNGGLVILTVPGDPYRCPPGPYERASLMAHYLKMHKPKSKILILDTKEEFSKKNLFVQAWQQLYPGMIEWIAGSEGGKVVGVDVKEMSVTTDQMQTHKAQVINVIPPQQAGTLVVHQNLVDNTGWSPVNPMSFESSLQKNIHIIGDACMAGKMPKSAFAANNQAKVCAAAVVALLKDQALPVPALTNTCYSLVAPDYAISIAKVYRATEQGIIGIEGSGGNSPENESLAFRSLEARYTRAWYSSIVNDSFF